jgi:hypothetical protein
MKKRNATWFAAYDRTSSIYHPFITLQCPILQAQTPTSGLNILIAEEVALNIHDISNCLVGFIAVHVQDVAQRRDRAGVTISARGLSATILSACPPTQTPVESQSTATHGMCSGLVGNPGMSSAAMLVPPISVVRASRSSACQSQKILSSQVWCR